MLCRPCVPAAQYRRHPRELLAPERSVHATAGKGPAGFGLLVLEGRRLRRDLIREERERPILELLAEGDPGPGHPVPEDGDTPAAHAIAEHRALHGGIDGESHRLSACLDAHDEIFRAEPRED